MVARSFVLEDWKGGEFGALGAAGAPKDTYTGTNVQRFRDGALGPRPGVKAVAPSGIPTGAMWGLTALRPVEDRGVVFGVGSKVYGFTLATVSAVDQIGSDIAVTPTTAQQFFRYGQADIYLAVSADKAYKITPSTDSLTALAAANAGAHVVTVYGDTRLVLANSAANPNRVYYSAPGDFTSWPALNFFDVAGNEITYINEIRQRLAIGERTGEWYALSGTPGVNDVLRRQSRADLSPWEHFLAARTGESVWYLPEGQTFPVQFSGISVDKLRYHHLETRLAGAGRFASGSMPASEIVLFTEESAKGGLLFYDGSWSAHTFGVSPAFLTGSGAGLNTAAADGPFVLSDGGGASAAPKFWSFQPALDRPGKTSDTYAQPGDASTTPLDAHLATVEVWGQLGEDLVVRTVIVDFQKWNTGSSSTNHFDLTVRALHRYNTDSYKDSGAQTFDEATSATTADKTDDRRVFKFGDQAAAHGFQLRFDNLRGVAIKRVTIDAIAESRK